MAKLYTCRSYVQLIALLILVSLAIIYLSRNPLSCVIGVGSFDSLTSLPMNKIVSEKYSPNDSQEIVFTRESPLVRLYLDVIRDTVCGLSLRTQERAVNYDRKNVGLMNLDMRIKGLDWPLIGITMVGQSRLKNLEWALRFVIGNGVPGDFIECGVWRGGSSLFARAVLQALSVTDREVWLADSFEGLPKARTTNDNDQWSKQEYLKVSLEEVQTNFRAFNLLDEHVHFCKGFFVDSLPHCNVSKIAVLRMDGDMYESTMDQLFNLYSKVEVGGVIIVDDYTIPECNRAIHDFRQWHQMNEELRLISGQLSARYWVKEKQVDLQKQKYESLLVTKRTSTV